MPIYQLSSKQIEHHRQERRQQARTRRHLRVVAQLERLIEEFGPGSVWPRMLREELDRGES